jgi:nucleoside-diphosphate-sugar epimerase
MKVLLTGAFRNLGLMVIRECSGGACRPARTFQRRNRRARAHEGRVEIAWGDIRDAAWLARQVEDVDAVIHLAGLLPPATDDRPELAEAVDVTATKQLVAALARSPRPPLLLYPSSLTVFGVTRTQPPPRRVSDPVVATDAYTRHKLAVEDHLAASSSPWVIFRIGVSVDSRTLSADLGTLRKLIAVRADNRLEYVHPEDVALAMVNAVQRRDAVERRTLLIGGGPRCQVTQSVFLGTALEAAGLRWSASHHGNDEYYNWMAESQRLLDYQRHLRRLSPPEGERLRWVRRLLWPLRPLLNPLLASFVRRLNRRAN